MDRHTPGFAPLFQAVTHQYMSLREEESTVVYPCTKSIASPWVTSSWDRTKPGKKCNLLKKKITTHPPFWQPMGGKTAIQNKAASAFWGLPIKSSREASRIIVQNPYLYVHPELWLSPELYCKKERIWAVFPWYGIKFFFSYWLWRVLPQLLQKPPE